MHVAGLEMRADEEYARRGKRRSISKAAMRRKAEREKKRRGARR